MATLIQTYAKHWGRNPADLLEEYDYQPTLTPILDAKPQKKFSRDMLHQIILWKVNRWPDQISKGQMRRLSALAKLNPGEHRKANDLLRDLLHVNGIGLPMASTIFRFINPEVFQIIDDRAHRAIKPFLPDRFKARYPKTKPPVDKKKQWDNYLKNSCDRYFAYLDTLRKHSSKNFPFCMADRILYQVDILNEKKIGDD